MTQLKTTARWFAGLPSERARVNLICLPFAGGGANAYWDWNEKLPSDVRVCAVRLPGRESRLSERPYTDLHQVVVDVADALEPLLLAPFALFGHSMGAVLAFELARELVARGRLPVHLFVSGRGAPGVEVIVPPRHPLSDEEFVASVVELGGMPDELLATPELLEIVLPALRADFAMIEGYRYVAGAKLTCPITALGGEQDNEVSRAMLDAWAQMTSKPFSAELFPGDHFFIQSHCDLVLSCIQRCLSLSL